jgi:hypothetical protein
LVWGIQNRRQIDRLIGFVYLLATFTAIMALLQFAVGVEVRLLPGISRVELLSEGDPFAPTRVLPIGLTLILPVLFVVSYRLFFKPGFLNAFYLGWLTLLGSAILISFTRSLWVSVLVGYIFMVLWSRSKLRGLLTAIVVLPFVFFVIQTLLPSSSSYVVERFYEGFGLQGRALDANTVGRIQESQAFLQQGLASTDRTLAGTGMQGKVYVDLYGKVSLVPENGYVHLFYAAGLLGLGAFAWVVLQYFRQVTKTLSTLPPNSDNLAILMGFWIGSVGLLINNISTLTLTTKYNGVIVMVLAMAMPRLIQKVEPLYEEAAPEKLAP